ncbi:MAG: hypothetical protein ACOYB1_00315 [Limnohabitans sp.]
MSNIDRLVYRAGLVSDEIYDAASDAAAQCGYDQTEEVLLDYTVLDIRWVSTDSVKALYPEFLIAPCSFSPDEIVRVDWLTWAVPKRFDGRYESAVIGRSESIVVAVSTLIEREVFTYGLGPEYNWLEWGEGGSPSLELPATVFEALGELIIGDWREQVREHADEDPIYLDGIHPSLRAAVAQVIAERDK